MSVDFFHHLKCMFQNSYLLTLYLFTQRAKVIIKDLFFNMPNIQISQTPGWLMTSLRNKYLKFTYQACIHLTFCLVPLKAKYTVCLFSLITRFQNARRTMSVACALHLASAMLCRIIRVHRGLEKMKTEIYASGPISHMKWNMTKKIYPVLWLLLLVMHFWSAYKTSVVALVTLWLHAYMHTWFLFKVQRFSKCVQMSQQWNLWPCDAMKCLFLVGNWCVTP